MADALIATLLASMILINPLLLAAAGSSWLQTQIKLRPLVPLTINYVIALFGSTWVHFLLTWWLGYDAGNIVAAVGLMILSVLILVRHRPRLSEIVNELTPKLIFFIGFWWLLFVPLLGSRMLPMSKGVWYSGGGSWADLALHSTYINSFANQTELSLRNPVYSQEFTRYPFMINFYSGLLVRYGVNIQAALFLPGLFLFTSALILLYFLCQSISQSAVLPWLVSFLFFLNGGLGWWIALPQLLNTGGNILTELPLDYTNIPESGYFWTNIITTYLLPQRGFLAAFPAYLAVLYLLIDVLEKPQRQTLMVSALIIGLLPWFHAHTFLVLVGLYVGAIGWLVINQQLTFKQIWPSLLILGLLALPQFGWQFITSSAAALMPTFRFGWMKKDTETLLAFWWKNWGLFLILFIGGMSWFLPKPFHRSLAVIVVLSLMSFGLTNLFLFQAHDWDNMKFMLLNYFVFCVVAAGFLLQFGKRWWGRGAIVIILLLTTLSGALALTRETQQRWVLSNQEDQELAAAVKRFSQPDDIFLTADTHNHPVPMVAGRRVVMGYRGWLWTHGINYRQTERDIRDIYTGANNAVDMVKKYHIDYVVVGSRERNQFAVNDDFFAEYFQLVTHTGSTQIYALY